MTTADDLSDGCDSEALDTTGDSTCKPYSGCMATAARQSELA